jgi:hypothetical protein
MSIKLNLAKEQRAGVYAEAAKIVASCEFTVIRDRDSVDNYLREQAGEEFDPYTETRSIGSYACHAVAMAVDSLGLKPVYEQYPNHGTLSRFEEVVTEENFPELFAFRDTDRINMWLSFDQDEPCQPSRKILPSTAAGNELRQTVLLLCHEMCED